MRARLQPGWQRWALTRVGQCGALALLWLAAALVGIAVGLRPERTTASRLLLASSCIAAALLPLLALPIRVRRPALALLATCLAAVAIAPRAADVALRSAYIDALRGYDGTRYVWGGETRRGIDCSGYVRMALADALALRAAARLGPGDLRAAAALWWTDQSAEALRDGEGGRTRQLLRASSINRLDLARLQPGDLAVTEDGRHVLAWLGDGRFAQADPIAMRVHFTPAPDAREPWFKLPLVIVRWSLLEGTSGESGREAER